jgi:hypothetical protein
MRRKHEMADVLVICIREEDKDDFPVELIKGLMSQGLTVSYVGAIFHERENEYTYDSVVNLLFFASTYFRRAPMISEDFKTWRGFLDRIDFEQVEAKTVIYVVTQNIELKKLEKEFEEFLRTFWSNIVVEMIKDSFVMDFSTFKSHYFELVEFFGLDSELYEKSRCSIVEGNLREEDEWGSPLFNELVSKCSKVRKEIEAGDEPSREISLDLEEIQRKVEAECFEDPEKRKSLFSAFFEERLISKTSENPERAMFFDIKRRCPRKNVLCLYSEEEKKEVDLYFYPMQPTEEEAKKSEEEAKKSEEEAKKSEEEAKKSEEEAKKSEEEAKKSEEEAKKSNGKKPETKGEGMPAPKKHELPRFKLHLEETRELYASKSIKKIINEHIMMVLHPPVVNIFFPFNSYMLEIDPEEPEIGFLSKKVGIDNQKLEVILRIDPKLRKKLHIYKIIEEEEKKDKAEKSEKIKKFQKLEKGYRSRNKEDIFIFGRIEDLYRILIATTGCLGRLYPLIYSSLKPLVILMIPVVVAMGGYLSKEISVLPLFLWVVGVLLIVSFVFWTLKTFILRYLLEPFFVMLKWFFFLVLLIAILLDKSGSKIPFGFILLFIPPTAVIVFHYRYICSAILYEFNDLFGIINQSDVLRVENSRYLGKTAIVQVLNSGRFQMVVKKNDMRETLFNSDLFHNIKYIQKRIRTLPKRIAYSSGIFPLSVDKKSLKEKESAKDGIEGELLYKKPYAKGYWRIPKRFLLDKKRVESEKGADEDFPEDTRHIYFGEWNHVIRCIRSTIPISPQSVLFRNMILLATLSGLIFNIFRFQMEEMTLTNFLSYLRNIGPLSIVFYSIISLIWFILSVGRLKFQFWKALLILVFLYLWCQHSQKFWVVAVLLYILIILSFLLCFSLVQTIHSFRIWANEKWNGNLISIVAVPRTEVPKNFLPNEISLYCSYFFRIFENEKVEGNGILTVNSLGATEIFLPIEMVLWCQDFFVVWADEKVEGNAISVIGLGEGLKGTITRKSLLTIELSMRYSDGFEEERVYFNKQFWNDIIGSYKWNVIRENEGSFYEIQ